MSAYFLNILSTYPPPASASRLLRNSNGIQPQWWNSGGGAEEDTRRQIEAIDTRPSDEEADGGKLRRTGGLLLVFSYQQLKDHPEAVRDYVVVRRSRTSSDRIAIGDTIRVNSGRWFKANFWIATGELRIS